jgi:hypothetical protein
MIHETQFFNKVYTFSTNDYKAQTQLRILRRSKRV